MELQVIGKPIKIGNLLVAQNDFPKEMNWNNAKTACAKLGQGWRLPTKDELNTLYQNKEKIGGFTNNVLSKTSNSDYWTSSVSTGVGWFWFQDLQSGDQWKWGADNMTIHVRAVRSVKGLPNQQIVEKSVSQNGNRAKTETKVNTTKNSSIESLDFSKIILDVLLTDKSKITNDGTSWVYFLDHNPYGDSFQCERCGNLSKSKKKPNDYSNCYDGYKEGKHSWKYADTNGGYRCSGGCGLSSYLIDNHRHVQPSGGQFGKCISTRLNDIRFHSWRRL
jgi:hypothetical protein